MIKFGNFNKLAVSPVHPALNLIRRAPRLVNWGGSLKAPANIPAECHMTVTKGQAASSPVYLEPKDGLQALERINTVILDCDGVLWRGSDLIPGTLEGLAALRSTGKRLLFVTNNSSKSRHQCLSKFNNLGIQVDTQELVPTSYTAAAYLQSIGFQGRVFLIGGSGMEQELQVAGIEYITFESAVGQQGNGASGGEQGWSVEGFKELQLAEDFKAVVVGYDEQFTYDKLCYASACLREIPDCLFVATNLDNADHIGNGRMMPGTGCIVSAIETATNRTAFNVGKGGSWLLPFLCETYHVQPQEACIVGDRLDTDIAMGRAGGLRTVLPLTGVTTRQDLQEADADAVPDFVVPSFGSLLGVQ